MKYFLDFGTHKFEGLEEFIEKIQIDKTFNVLCFEPNTDIYNLSRENDEILKKYENIFFSFKHYNLAVLNYSGKTIFNSHKGALNIYNVYDKNYTTGSNCLDVNPQYDSGNGVVFDIVSSNCNCIDVNEIISSIVKNDNDAEIYIKCDIEGSEFVVLPKLLDSPYLNKIKNIYIEWHERFWYGTNDYQNKINEKVDIINKFNCQNINTFLHS